MPGKPPQTRATAKSRRASSGVRRAGQAAARTARRAPNHGAKPLPPGSVPVLVVVAVLMLLPAGWGLGVLLGVFGDLDGDPTGRLRATALAVLAAGGSLAAVCLAAAWFVRRQHVANQG
ncbi:MAG: hypothetical protein AAGE65_10615 [Planctomycetota bacterium]